MGTATCLAKAAAEIIWTTRVTCIRRYWPGGGSVHLHDTCHLHPKA